MKPAIFFVPQLKVNHLLQPSSGVNWCHISLPCIIYEEIDTHSVTIYPSTSKILYVNIHKLPTWMS